MLILTLLYFRLLHFPLLCTQLFGGIYNPSTGYSLQTACPGDECSDGFPPKPSYHFDYCYPAMLSIFVLLTGEWIDATEPAATIMGPVCALFFIFVVLLGKYLLVSAQYTPYELANSSPAATFADLTALRMAC